jgi:general secretion pathway protein H
LRRSASSGFTLLELMIVLGIVAGLSLILVWGVRKGRKSDLRNDVNTARSALKAAFDRSAATGAAHRVIFDLEQESFRIERCEGEMILRRSTDEAEAQEAAQLEQRKLELLGQDFQDQAKQQSMAGGQPVAEIPALIQTSGLPACAPAQGRVGRVVELARGKGVKIEKVWVAHLEEAVTEGQVVIHFFPPGWAERAIVEIGDGEDSYSLVVEPLTGRIKMERGEIRDAAAYIRQDAEGKEVFEE